MSANSTTVPSADVITPATRGPRIVVADDNRDAAHSLAMILELSAHDVRVVHMLRYMGWAFGILPVTRHKHHIARQIIRVKTWRSVPRTE